MPNWTLEALEAEYPAIKWREPALMRVIGDPQEHYACKICIANNGLLGKDIPQLTTEPAPVKEHLRTAHGA